MSDIDLPLRHALDVLVPEPRREPDWLDVLQRAQPRLWRRPLVLALAAALLMLGTAAGVTAALGGFDAWLSGKPGKPAPASEQQRFETANGRTWAAFPRGTRLRELIRTNAGGRTYVLFGFRSGGTLCLKLKAVSPGHSTQASCAPVSTLAHVTAPIVVVQGQSEFDDKHAHPSAEFSFGVAADGVSRVDIHAVDGTHRAVLGGNAYLWVENEPNTGNRVLSISAKDARGRRTTFPLFTMFDARTAPALSPKGPTRVQTKIAHPIIGWHLRNEPRGVPVSKAKLTPDQRRFILEHDLGFTRLVKPDPLSNIVVGLTGNLGLFVLAPWPSIASGVSFQQGPLIISLTGASDQFVGVEGAAADGVERVTIFLADGQRQRAALRDNVFTALVADAEFPIRVVAYDARNRVVGIQTFKRQLFGSVVPAAAGRNLHRVRRITGDNGTVGTVRIGHAVRGYRCWRVDFTTGQSPSGCLELLPTGPWTQVDVVQPAGRDVFVIGHVRAPAERVQLEFANGDVIRTRPSEDLFVFAVPRAHLSPKRQLAYAVGYSTEGWRIQRQGVLFRANS